MKEAITSGEIGKQGFVNKGFIFFAHENLCHILKKYTEIVIAHLLDLEDGLLRLLISVSFYLCNLCFCEFLYRIC